MRLIVGAIIRPQLGAVLSRFRTRMRKAIHMQSLLSHPSRTDAPSFITSTKVLQPPGLQPAPCESGLEGPAWFSLLRTGGLGEIRDTLALHPEYLELRDESGRTALLAAIENDNAPLLDMLLAGGASTAGPGPSPGECADGPASGATAAWGRNALTFAVACDATDTIVLALREAAMAGHPGSSGLAAALNAPDLRGQTPLTVALERHHARWRLHLASQAENPATPADAAADTRMARLLDWGARALQPEMLSDDALWLAASSSNKALASLPFEHKGCPVKDSAYQHWLQGAIHQGNAFLVGLLFETGRDSKLRVTEKIRCMALAADGGNRAMFDDLWNRWGNEFKVRPRDVDELLMQAARVGSLEVTRALMANPAARFVEATQALEVAVRNGHLGMVRELTDRLRSFATCEENAFLPALAVAHGHKEILELLLDKGLPIDSFSNRSDTPLRVALAAGRTDLVELLVRRGAKAAVTRDGPVNPAEATRNRKNARMAGLH